MPARPRASCRTAENKILPDLIFPLDLICHMCYNSTCSERNAWSHGSVGSTYWYLRRKAHGRMAQLVEHSGRFLKLKLRSHGSVGRAHRSHRWGHRFESCCDHQAEALENQGLLSYSPLEAVSVSPCFFIPVNSLFHQLSQVTVAWLNCRKSHGSVAIVDVNDSSTKKPVRPRSGLTGFFLQFRRSSVRAP